MTVDEAEKIISTMFNVIERINTLHITGGGEPFIHPQLAEIINITMKYMIKFDRLMLFTNSVTAIKDDVFDLLRKHKDKIVVQMSLYGINPGREKKIVELIQSSGVECKIEKYYGNDQSFGGWVDFGVWESYARAPSELECVFRNCAITRHMSGNWRTRNGKVHWCSRSQRGMELGLIPNNPDDYVDLFDETSFDDKRGKFQQIAESRYITACDYCSGDQGTTDVGKRIPAAVQI